nr:venom protein U-MPTX.6-7 [Megalopyge opercularis]
MFSYNIVLFSLFALSIAVKLSPCPDADTEEEKQVKTIKILTCDGSDPDCTPEIVMPFKTVTETADVEVEIDKDEDGEFVLDLDYEDKENIYDHDGKPAELPLKNNTAYVFRAPLPEYDDNHGYTLRVSLFDDANTMLGCVDAQF